MQLAGLVIEENVLKYCIQFYLSLLSTKCNAGIAVKSNRQYIIGMTNLRLE